MFDWLRGKKPIGQDSVAKLRSAPDAQLQHSPRTLALVRHARAISDAAYANLQDVADTKNVRPAKHDETLSDEVISALSTNAYHITSRSMKKNSVDVFLPGMPLPKEAPAIVAFNMLVALSLKDIVAAEGHSVSRELNMRASSALFFMHDPDQSFRVVAQGSKIANSCLTSDMENVRQWRVSLLNLAMIYCLSIMEAANAPTVIEVEGLYGSSLKSLLAAVE